MTTPRLPAFGAPPPGAPTVRPLTLAGSATAARRRAPTGATTLLGARVAAQPYARQPVLPVRLPFDLGLGSRRSTLTGAPGNRRLSIPAPAVSLLGNRRITLGAPPGPDRVRVLAAFDDIDDGIAQPRLHQTEPLLAQVVEFGRNIVQATQLARRHALRLQSGQIEADARDRARIKACEQKRQDIAKWFRAEQEKHERHKQQVAAQQAKIAAQRDATELAVHRKHLADDANKALEAEIAQVKQQLAEKAQERAKLIAAADRDIALYTKLTGLTIAVAKPRPGTPPSIGADSPAPAHPIVFTFAIPGLRNKAVVSLLFGDAAVQATGEPDGPGVYRCESAAVAQALTKARICIVQCVPLVPLDDALLELAVQRNVFQFLKRVRREMAEYAARQLAAGGRRVL
ncbi:hypothetical protein GGF31_004454 [Allomyces arbusculus]|nr:hypothetical protein GGF31_004454 [Allomyces arbusculus]